jgi:hypothetical protein
MKLVQNTSNAVKSGKLSVGVSANSTLHKKKTNQYGSWVQLSNNLGNYYQAKLDEDCIFEIHVNQLRKTEIPKRPVSFAPSTKSEEDDNLL